MKHKHIYDNNGKQLCCTQEERINLIADLQLNNKQEEEGCCTIPEPIFGRINNGGYSHENPHNQPGANSITLRIFFPAIISFVLLSIAIIFDNLYTQPWFSGWLRVIWYILAYGPVGFPVL
ncbi:MAG TPA: hypothetical protein DG754_05820 [Bacteroidales bacterium]|nr:hypothetical protein [Bacteroidales bacterium]